MARRGDDEGSLARKFATQPLSLQNCILGFLLFFLTSQPYDSARWPVQENTDTKHI